MNLPWTVHPSTPLAQIPMSHSVSSPLQMDSYSTLPTCGVIAERKMFSKVWTTRKTLTCASAASPTPCNDNGTWSFSTDDVRGQEDDVQNNFGQSGSFSRSFISMYPKRAVDSEKCEFCWVNLLSRNSGGNDLYILSLVSECSFFGGGKNSA